MQKLQLYIIRFLFSAFLPPKDDEENEKANSDYYDLLGVNNKTCPMDEIRKAYKKKSLQYHPDKVAQFARNSNSAAKSKEEIEAEFVQIKEAYETLSDVNKRNAYDVLGLEGGRMISNMVGEGDGNGGGLELHSLVYNLARASFVDKSKLFALVVLAVAWVLLSPILVCIKVDSSINADGPLYDTDWIILLIPIGLLNVLYLFLLIVGKNWVAILRMLCIFTLEVLLTLKVRTVCSLYALLSYRYCISSMNGSSMLLVFMQ